MQSSESIVRVGIIMAGGSGERFWPVSRRHHPKQLLRLTSPNETMLGEAVSRIAPLIPPERVYVVTAEHLVQAIQDADVGVPSDNVIAEPCKRNTGGCLAFAAAHVLAHHGGDPARISMAVITADHLIGDTDRFRRTVDVALEIAEKNGVLATHGIIPTRPETGYGYIQAEDMDNPVWDSGDILAYPVAAFHEKPNHDKAQDFIATGSYFWNSGMFFWRIDTFLEELEAARPDMAEAVRKMHEAMNMNDKGSVRAIFEGLDDISIDYALMEHAKQVVVVGADYPWDDVGAWTSLDRTREHDEQGNVARGGPVLIDTHNSIVYNDVGAEDMAVSVVGMDNVVVVVSKDGVLVVPKDRAQDVRHAVAELKARGAKQI